MAMGALIDVVLFMGLVTKDAILLVDRADRARTRPRRATAASHPRGGPRRLRPILMTSAAMILGMLPTAVSNADGSEFRAPMAIAVIGGVISSTLLSLIVVPVFYLTIENIKGFISRRRSWWRAARAGAQRSAYDCALRRRLSPRRGSRQLSVCGLSKTV